MRASQADPVRLLRTGLTEAPHHDLLVRVDVVRGGLSPELIGTRHSSFDDGVHRKGEDPEVVARIDQQRIERRTRRDVPDGYDDIDRSLTRCGKDGRGGGSALAAVDVQRVCDPTNRHQEAAEEHRRKNHVESSGSPPHVQQRRPVTRPMRGGSLRRSRNARC